MYITKERLLLFPTMLSILSLRFFYCFVVPCLSENPKISRCFKMSYSSRYSNGRRAVVKPASAALDMFFIMVMWIKFFNKQSPCIGRKNNENYLYLPYSAFMLFEWCKGPIRPLRFKYPQNMDICIKVQIHIYKIFRNFKRFLVALALTSPPFSHAAACLLSAQLPGLAEGSSWNTVILLPWWGPRCWGTDGHFGSLCAEQGAAGQERWWPGNIRNPVALQKLSTNQCFRKGFFSLWFIACEAFHVHTLILAYI